MTPIGRLHVLTDFSFQQRLSHSDLTRLAIQGGAEVIQFRQKHGRVRDWIPEAIAVREVCKAAGVTFLINDRVDLAQVVEADGVHLGQEDIPAGEVRRILGPNAIIGVTTPNKTLALQAKRDGANYVGFGPVFVTRSKSNPTSVQGISGLTAFCVDADLPVIAIGGITVEGACEAIAAGAHGVAVMTAVSLAQYPELEAQKFQLALRG